MTNAAWPSIEQAVDLAAAPSRREFDGRIERGEDASYAHQRQVVQVAALEPGDGRLRHAREPCHIGLAHARTTSQRTHDEADTGVLHPDIVTAEAYVAIIG